MSASQPRLVSWNCRVLLILLSAVGGAATGCTDAASEQDTAFGSDDEHPTDDTSDDSSPDSDSDPFGDSDTSIPDTESGGYAVDIEIVRIEANQGTAVALYRGGRLLRAEERAVQIVSERPLLFRAYWERQSGFRNREITAVLRWLTPDGTEKEHSQTLRIDRVSGSENMEDTFSFLISGDAVVSGARFQLALIEGDPSQAGAPNPGRGVLIPEGEPTPLDPVGIHAVLKLALVPFVPPGGLPIEISEADRQAVEEMLIERSPVSEILVDWKAPVSQTTVYSRTDEPWTALSDIRQADSAGPEWYYHALLNRDGCCDGDAFEFSGLGGYAGPTQNPEDVWARTALIPVGEEGLARAAISILHELGHNQGRYHAPCGNGADPDPDYPYDGGGIGTQGYSILSEKLYSADPDIARPYTDIMGYCRPTWISDYTFEGLRVRAATLSSWPARSAYASDTSVLRIAVTPGGVSHRFERVPTFPGAASSAPQTVFKKGASAALCQPGRPARPLSVLESPIPGHPLRAFTIPLPAACRTGGTAVQFTIDDRIFTIPVPPQNES